MSDRIFYWFMGTVITVLLAILAVILWLIVQRPSGNGPPPVGCQLFPETGKTVCGRFLTYWQEHGGVGQQGYPLSGEFREVSLINRRTYTVQYFERAVFEYHPENQPPYDVLLSLLGTIRYHQQYPTPVAEATVLPAALHPAGGVLFPQTSKMVRGVFLDYWLAHGGPMQYGYPITNPFIERSAVDGQEYLVQYFERAEFELHPQNQAPYNVLPALVGRLEFQRKYPAGDPSAAPPPAAAASPTPTPASPTPTPRR